MEYSVVIASASQPQTITVRLIAEEGGVDIRLTNSDPKYGVIEHRLENATLAEARTWVDAQTAGYQEFCNECDAVLNELTAMLISLEETESEPTARSALN
jgi:hypothetical protein